MTLFTLLAVAWATDPDPLTPAGLFDTVFEAPHTPPNAHYPGHFDGPPVPHWRVALPGDTLNSATHTERSRPTFHEESILIGSAAGRGVYRLSRRDGGIEQVYPASASVESEALVVEDQVCFGDTGGVTQCYTLDGDLRWSHDSKSPILVRPTVHEGVLYITNVNDLALAFDLDTGEQLWRYQAKRDLARDTELTLYGSPPAVVVDSGEAPIVIFGFSDGSLSALTLDGDPVWSKRIGEGRYPDIVAEPVQHGRDIYASGYFQPLVALDTETQNVRWRIDVGAASAVAVDTRDDVTVLYHPGTDGALRAVLTLTGAERWTWESDTKGALTRPVITEAGILVGSSAGSLYLIDPEDGSVKWRYREMHLLQGVTAAPTINGRQAVFVSNAGYLYSMLVPQVKRAGKSPSTN